MKLLFDRDENLHLRMNGATNFRDAFLFKRNGRGFARLLHLDGEGIGLRMGKHVVRDRIAVGENQRFTGFDGDFRDGKSAVILFDHVIFRAGDGASHQG